jgi:two-component system cell cycle response regulator
VALPQGGGRVSVTVSIGLAQSGRQAGEAGATRLLARADRALFAAKAAGRNKVTVEVDDAA